MKSGGGVLWILMGFFYIYFLGSLKLRRLVVMYVCIIRELVLFIEGSGFIWISYLIIILFCNDAKEIVPVV